MTEPMTPQRLDEIRRGWIHKDDVMYFKVLDVDGRPCNGGTGQWSLPTTDGPGQWMPSITDPIPCERGYHLCRDTKDLLAWLGPTIWMAEARGVIIPDGDKVVAEQARLVRRLPWDDRLAQLFAADCAEHVLPIFERKQPDDDRPRKAIEAARAFARGEINAAARAAAGDTERDWQATKLSEYLGLMALTGDGPNTP